MRRKREQIFLKLCLALLMLLMGSCSGFLYYPNAVLYSNPKQLDPIPEEIHIDAEDKTHVHAWYFRAKEKRNKKCISYFHGNGGNRSGHYIHLYWLIKHGYDLYIFDYPGYGDNKGSPTPKNTVVSAVAAMKYVQRQDCEKQIVYGHSLGGQIAMRASWELKEQLTPDLLIIDSSFLSYKKVGNRALRSSWITWIFSPLSYVLLSDDWAITDKVKELGMDKIIIHTKTDQIVPFELGEEISEKSTAPKEFWIKDSGEHNNIYYDPKGLKLRKKLLDKLDSL